MFEDVHDEDGQAQAEDVGCKAGVEVGVGVLLQASVMMWGERRVRLRYCRATVRRKGAGEDPGGCVGWLSSGPGAWRWACTLILPQLSVFGPVTFLLSASVYSSAKWENHEPSP